MSFWLFWHRLSSAKGFMAFANIMRPIAAAIAMLCLSYGLFQALYQVPADYQQGDAFRIIYVHVPCAFLSLMVYGLITIAAVIYLIWRIKLANCFIDCAAPIGAQFTLLALITGSIWGKPMWGAWWVWDARLTAELLLLLIYGGVIALSQAFHHGKQGAILKNTFVLIGSVNLPIIHYSVYWWNSLHQGETLKLLGPSHIAPSMAKPLWLMIIGFIAYFTWLVLLKLQTVILKDNQHSRWLRQWLKNA